MSEYGGVPYHVKKVSYTVFLPSHLITAGYLIKALSTIPSGATIDWSSIAMAALKGQQPTGIEFSVLERGESTK